MTKVSYSAVPDWDDEGGLFVASVPALAVTPMVRHGRCYPTQPV